MNESVWPPSPKALGIPGSSGDDAYRSGTPTSLPGVFDHPPLHGPQKTGVFTQNSPELSSMPPAMQPMSAGGSAPGTTSSKTTRDKVGDAFLEHLQITNPDLVARWGLTWTQVPEREACSNTIFEYLATYVSSVYIIPKGRVNAGEHLSQDSAENYWGGMIDDRRKQFQQSAEQSSQVRTIA